ncbi:COQ9 family ubiquinone biosynthesis protein [Haematobacter missouriensis]|uniref:Ubiquinone biosynthesis protein n=1 Tax=Haematobacter missouriensis TaxID=366616 RepID=A0A212AV35_9RHOB|nr:COQ9 family protein [Haematobacter missouriensis]KFI33841.1 COQ9 family ubiquinone biosynthesis protein [Haematobacter missouriensis]OWJ72237.1 ubiquinone biosynthesis protein [Haematobacter missouriensis]OWJ85347.1 ubiquinone biosynthesis protein [Haematobacter missouriensis]
MTETSSGSAHSMEEVRDRLLDAALPHVVFDGWTAVTYRAAVDDSGLDPTLAHMAAPRGAIDLAHAFHVRGDRRMAEALAASDLSALRFRERVAKAVMLRLELAGDREAVRRGMTLFSLPQHAAEGSRLVWETADTIWTALGDTADDLNWYTKRASLSGVFGATVLYWLGDETPDSSATAAFLERRIDGVMRIEKTKSFLRKTPGFNLLMTGPDWLARQVPSPERCRRDGLPGRRSRTAPGPLGRTAE